MISLNSFLNEKLQLNKNSQIIHREIMTEFDIINYVLVILGFNSYEEEIQNKDLPIMFIIDHIKNWINKYDVTLIVKSYYYGSRNYFDTTLKNHIEKNLGKNYLKDFKYRNHITKSEIKNIEFYSEKDNYKLKDYNIFITYNENGLMLYSVFNEQDIDVRAVKI